MAPVETPRPDPAPPPPAQGPAAARHLRRGLLLFALYVGLYAGYVFLNAFRPQAMEAAPVAGVNLAISYGLGLIAAAFVLALIYAWLCRDGGGHPPPGDRAP